MDKKVTAKITIILIVIIGLVAARFASGVWGQFSRQNAMKLAMIPPVKTSVVEEVSVVEHFEAPARIVAKYNVNLVARVDGFLQKSYFKEGDYVKKGQILFRIEPDGYAATSAKASANLQYAKAQLAQSEKDFKRAQELVKLDYIAKSSYDDALAKRDVARANVRAQNAALYETNKSLSYTTIKAPFSGRIGMIKVTEGNYVSISDGPIANLVSLDPMYVTFPIDSKRFALMQTQAKQDKTTKRRVELYFSDGRKYQYDGIEDFIDNQIDPTTGTITLRATFKNPDRELIAGDFANIKMYENHSVEKPAIPIKAVLQDPTGHFVYTLSEDNTAKVTPIVIGTQVGDKWTVEEGLKVGDEIITDGISKVIKDRPVRILKPEEQISEEKAKEGK